MVYMAAPVEADKIRLFKKIARSAESCRISDGTDYVMSQECPRCGLFSPDGVHRCDCGYDFTTRSSSAPRRNPPGPSGILTAVFFLHLGVATVSTVSGLAAALMLGLAGTIELFAPVVVAAIVTGWFVAGRLNAQAATWVWVPAAIWFSGWALSSWSLGLDHFMRVFVGVGYCGDFSCAGQWFVTSPLVGSISYVLTVRGVARTVE
jgi:hypothetical protein